MSKWKINKHFLIIFLLFNIFYGQDSLKYIDKYSNIKKNITVTINNDLLKGIRILRIKTTRNDFAYKTNVLDDVGNIFVNFFDLNNDKYDDIIIEMADEIGYSPHILINIKNVKFKESLRQGDFYIEYSNLESEVDGKPYKSYRFEDLDNDGINEIIFNHIYEKNNFYKNVVFKLNKNQVFERKE